jgi:membrane protease YdiL (CAAX protease family)
MGDVERATARKQVLTYTIITFALSWVVMGYVIATGGMAQVGNLILFVMWMPGLVSLAYRGAARLGLRDVGWRIGGLRFWALAILIPLFIAALSYALSWGLGIGQMRIPSDAAIERNGASSLTDLVLRITLISVVIGYFGALGEELGWRGFLLPKLYDAGVKRPLLTSSIIWGLWHFPLIIGGGYASSDMPIVSVILFMITIIFAGAIVGWLRMASGSVWVATMYHAAHNFFMQTAFEIFNKPGPLSPYLAGESGVIPGLMFAAVFFVGIKVLRDRAALPKT